VYNKYKNYMENMILSTKNTWCPGCGNFQIQKVLADVITEIGKEKTVLVSGVGCHGKMADYVDVNSFYSLHGRAISAGQGVKMGNEELNVICSVGDGDAYEEGMAHLIHAAKRDADITVIVHNNRVFALTVNQATSTSPKGFVSNTTPHGKKEKAINPLKIMLAMNAGFVGRGFVGKIEHLTRVIKQGVEHKGFSFIEVLQPCIAWHNTFLDYNERVYEMEKEFLSLKEAEEKAEEWDYNDMESKIPVGVFYKKKQD
jgi:2-oxoglutarate/2-oxoacid ferredoxin oxidoreductase subunit beta